MKKTYCCSKREEEVVLIEGSLICGINGSIYLVTDEDTIICVHSGYLSNVGMSLNVSELKDVYKVYHGSITMEN